VNLTAEAEIAQNPALGALALWAFCKGFLRDDPDKIGPPLQLAVFVLPMVLHEETLEPIRTRLFRSGLYLVLAENRDLNLALQERVKAMIPQTMESIHFAFAAKLLGYKPDSGLLTLLRKTMPIETESESARKIVAGASRLGYWFSQTNTSQLCGILNVQL
jgi:hypothetical protein